ncbi:MAG: hypothetical protein JST00_00385 [Deltaproteobacteria bacterium]|nr:hypothetical protein [Deltaproteobacteria bacterium]
MNTNKALLVILGVAAALVATACAEEEDPLTGRTNRPGTSGAPGEGEGEVTPAALQCTEKPEGRSYKNFDGNLLEAQRKNENVGVNRARLKPFAVMAGEYQRVLGLVPPGLAGSAGSFDEPPARWFAEASHSGVSLNAIFSISFEGCASYTKTAPEYGAAPTAETASTVCSTLMRKAWSRSASPEEISSCVNLATTKLAQEPDARRKWTYVCASVLSSSQFLTF